MGSYDPFGHLKHKLWPKERLGVKLAILLLTTKSWESPWFPCVQVACNISLEKSWQGLQLWFTPHFNWRSAHKVIGPQSHGVPTLGISGLSLRSFETKWPLGVGPVARHKVYYKGEGGGFPQVQAVVNFVNPWLRVVRSCTKVFQLCTNQLVVWFVQVCVSNWVTCQSS
jgi:hypothetical protein